MGTTKERLQCTAFAVIILLSCLEGALGSGVELSVDRPSVIVSIGGDVNITCTYEVDTFVPWTANGTIPVERLGISYVGGSVRGQPGTFFTTLMIRSASSTLNKTTFMCTLPAANASSLLYVLNPIASVEEIAPVYPLNKVVPMLICWTPPPAYMVAPIIHYHLKLTALISDANRGDVSNVVLPDGQMTCATMDNNSLLNSSNGGIFALSLAAENALGMSAYTSTSVVVSLFEGSTVNHDGGSDTYGFTVTTRSVKSDEGHISILVDWKLMYQWTPFKFQFHYLCTSTHNVTMETAFTNVTINGPFIIGEKCEVQVKACLRDDECAWAVTSKALPFTVDNPLVSGEQQDECGPMTVQPQASSDILIIIVLAVGLGASVIIFTAIATGIVVYFKWKARHLKRLEEAEKAAAIRNDLLNPYELNPYVIELGDQPRASSTGGAMVQYCRGNKTANEDEYMVMTGCRRSVSSPAPSEVATAAAQDGNKAYALYAEIGINAKTDLQ